MKFSSRRAWPAVAALLAGGFAHAFDGSPRTDPVAAIVTEEVQRTESVTLLVRGMMKSRSGAT